VGSPWITPPLTGPFRAQCAPPPTVLCRRTQACSPASSRRPGSSAPPSFPNRPSQGLHPRAPLRLYPTRPETHVQHQPKSRCTALRLAPGRVGGAAAPRWALGRRCGRGVAASGGGLPRRWCKKGLLFFLSTATLCCNLSPMHRLTYGAGDALILRASSPIVCRSTPSSRSRYCHDDFPSSTSEPGGERSWGR
jgi:hypothetical protein